MASSGNDASKNKQCFCVRLTEARKSAQLAMLAWKECDSKVFTGFKKPFKMWTGLLLFLLSFKRREYKQLIYGIKKEREKLWNVRWGEHVEQTNKNWHLNKSNKKSLSFFLSLELNVRPGSVLFCTAPWLNDSADLRKQPCLFDSWYHIYKPLTQTTDQNTNYRTVLQCLLISAETSTSSFKFSRRLLKSSLQVKTLSVFLP